MAYGGERDGFRRNAHDIRMIDPRPLKIFYKNGNKKCSIKRYFFPFFFFSAGEKKDGVSLVPHLFVPRDERDEK